MYCLNVIICKSLFLIVPKDSASQSVHNHAVGILFFFFSLLEESTWEKYFSDFINILEIDVAK